MKKRIHRIKESLDISRLTKWIWIHFFMLMEMIKIPIPSSKTASDKPVPNSNDSRTTLFHSKSTPTDSPSTSDNSKPTPTDSPFTSDNSKPTQNNSSITSDNFESVSLLALYHRIMSCLETLVYQIGNPIKGALLPAGSCLADLIFPPRCPVCDRYVSVNARICPECYQTLNRIIDTNRYCIQCGNVLLNEESRLCHDCKSRPHHYEMARSLYMYRDIAPSMYRFKYGERREYARFYGEEIIRTYAPLIKQWNGDVIIPVPIHYIRRQDRGYNQAEVLAKIIGKELHIPVKKHLLIRVKSTKPLKNLDLSGRQNNLKKAFKLCENVVKYKTIILIDDIYTTGSTMDACAHLLKRGGAEKIFVLTIAGGQEIDSK